MKLRNSSQYSKPKNVEVETFMNGKVIETIRPRVALHEVARRELAKSIEAENFKIAKMLVKSKPKIQDNREVTRDFTHHLKIKRMRCKEPIVNMKYNSFNPTYWSDYASRI